MTQEEYLKTVKRNGWALEYVPEELRTEVFYRNMSTICADMIRENIRVVDVIDDGFSNYSGMSGKGLYEHFIEIIEEMEKAAAYSTRSKKEGAE
jgi:hypothetical protein